MFFQGRPAVHTPTTICDLHLGSDEPPGPARSDETTLPEDFRCREGSSNGSAQLLVQWLDKTPDVDLGGKAADRIGLDAQHEVDRRDRYLPAFALE
jgi:hypothetical protein